MKDFSLVEFASFLGEIAEARTANHEALEEAAAALQKEAKRVIGTYDYDWPELADRTKEDRLRHGYSENEPGLRSGAMRDSIEKAVLADEAFVGSNNQKLIWFELGTSKQPPRPVLMGAAAHKEQEIVDAMGRTIVTALFK